MRTLKYKEYIIHLFITRENSFVAKTIGIKSTSRLCVRPRLCSAVNTGMLLTSGAFPFPIAPHVW